ncbi:DUF2177 family protein [Patescibacteria group bacterium]|nr:DUF2177 family protein [Patescibacteria group bacterium]
MSLSLLMTYVSVVLSTALLDFFWIGFLMKGTYEKGLGNLLAPSFNLLGAGLFYLLYAIGIMLFVVMPSEGKSLVRVLVLGIVFGFIAYGVYDLTNLATLRNWPWSITIMDMVWGAILTAVASGVGFLVFRSLN